MWSLSDADEFRPHYTYEDYLLSEGRWELNDGMPYARSPAPAPNHQEINVNLAIAFKTALKENCDKCKVYIPIDWKINEDTVVQTDVLIVCKKLEKKHLDFTPSLTIEILSPSTASKDRHEKFELYEQEGVQYYLIVDPQFKKIEIYELVNNKYQPVSVCPENFSYNLKEGCQFTVNFDGIWP